jgi:hypothetical protein
LPDSDGIFGLSKASVDGVSASNYCGDAMDINTSAYRVVQIATGMLPNKSTVKSNAGKLGASARAKSLSKKKRRAIARKANRARWSGHKAASVKEQGENGNRDS